MNIKLSKDVIFKLCRYIKILSLSIPNIKGQNIELLININIIQAILYNVFIHPKYENATIGFALITLLPFLKKYSVFDNEGLKIWFVLYYMWNMNLCNYNDAFNKDILFSHNFPPLYTILLSFGFSSDELLHQFALMRSSSIRSIFSKYLEDYSNAEK